LTELRWFQKEIGRRQLGVQRKAMERAWMQVDQHLTPYSNANSFQLRENLALEIRAIIKAEKELSLLQARPKSWWEDLVVKLYEWATKDRFDLSK
jgi:hypothetical protein